jgi:hypothetical protein
MTTRNPPLFGAFPLVKNKAADRIKIIVPAVAAPVIRVLRVCEIAVVMVKVGVLSVPEVAGVGPPTVAIAAALLGNR